MEWKIYNTHINQCKFDINNIDGKLYTIRRVYWRQKMERDGEYGRWREGGGGVRSNDIRKTHEHNAICCSLKCGIHCHVRILLFVTNQLKSIIIGWKYEMQFIFDKLFSVHTMHTIANFNCCSFKYLRTFKSIQKAYGWYIVLYRQYITQISIYFYTQITIIYFFH